MLILLHFGADGRNRTGDLRITNALLYQLSYIGENHNLHKTKSVPTSGGRLENLALPAFRD
jgi:hypothetical protein